MMTKSNAPDRLEVLEDRLHRGVEMLRCAETNYMINFLEKIPESIRSQSVILRLVETQITEAIAILEGRDSPPL